MNGYIVSRSVVGLQEAIKKAMETPQSAEAKAYLQEILKLPQEDQEKWFFSSEEVGRIGRKEYRAKGILEVIVTIVEICLKVISIIKEWNKLKKSWEEKQVEEPSYCREIEIEVPSGPGVRRMLDPQQWPT